MAVRRLKVKGDIFRTGMLESFPHEYMKLRYGSTGSGGGGVIVLT